MAQFLGTVQLGGFYNNGTILKRPTKPWRPDTDPGGAGGGLRRDGGGKPSRHEKARERRRKPPSRGLKKPAPLLGPLPLVGGGQRK